MIKFIPYPVTMGFTSGIAVLIFSTQIKDFFGLTSKRCRRILSAKAALSRTRKFSRMAHARRWPPASLAIILFWPKKSAAARAGFHRRAGAGDAGGGVVSVPVLQVETIGSKFGGIPQALPHPHFPALSWEDIQHLFQPATTIALLAAIESLLCAVVADGMIDDRHDSNQELMAQGIANIVSPLFRRHRGDGRDRPDGHERQMRRAHARRGHGSRGDAVGHILAAAPLAKYIPLATLSAVLVVVVAAHGRMAQFVRLEPLAEERRDGFSLRLQPDRGVGLADGGGCVARSWRRRCW